MGRGFVALTIAACWALPQAALAGEAHQVPHGMEVTTDAGETVRVLAYDDGTFRITVGKTLPEGRATAMVVTDPDGAPTFSSTAETATLQTDDSSAIVGLSDGRLTVYNAAGKMLLDEYTPARRLTPVTFEGQPWLATRVQFNRGTDEGLYGLGQHQNRQMNYNGEDVELAQHNMDIAVPYLLSTRGYGILWDNASVTRIGDPEQYEKLSADGDWGVITRGNNDHIEEEIQLPGWTAQYYQGDRLVADLLEDAIDYQYIRDLQGWPSETPATATSMRAGARRERAGRGASRTRSAPRRDRSARSRS